MRKYGLEVLLFLVTLLVGSYSLLVINCIAAEPSQQTQEESVSITTYYPSPYGAYNQLSSNKFSVGDTNGDGKLTDADQPPEDGKLYVAKSVIYKPQIGDPATWSTLNAKEGELAYSSSKDAFYAYNGSSWVAQVGAGAVVYAPKCSWNCSLQTSTYSCVGSCSPPSCVQGYTDLGTGCAAMGGEVFGPSPMQITPTAIGYGYCERYCVKQ